MSYDTEQLVELAEQNAHSVLEINLSRDNSIGSMGRTNIEVVDSGEDFIEAKLLNFAQVKDLDNPDQEEILKKAKYIEKYERGKGASLWLEGRTYQLNTSEIATATPYNMLSRAEEKQ